MSATSEAMAKSATPSSAVTMWTVSMGRRTASGSTSGKSGFTRKSVGSRTTRMSGVTKAPTAGMR